jgi:D-sedoheptulose 7-phosphate isomerase
VRGAPHVAALAARLGWLECEIPRLERWGTHIADELLGGARLLAVGNGGSAAQAEHLTGELVGRFTIERRPLSAIPLHGDTSSLTAIANDYGYREAFARQVRGHGRPGDILLALSVSGRSQGVLAAVVAAREEGLLTWALTGPEPNPLASLADDAVCVPAESTATVQELHLVALHIVCGAVDLRVRDLEAGVRLARRARRRAVPRESLG